MTFRTERLSAERLSQGHLAELSELHLDREVNRYLGGLGSPATSAKYLDDNLAHWDRHGFGLWIFRKADGAFGGRAGARRIDIEGAPEIELV